MLLYISYNKTTFTMYISIIDINNCHSNHTTSTAPLPRGVQEYCHITCPRHINTKIQSRISHIYKQNVRRQQSLNDMPHCPINSMQPRSPWTAGRSSPHRMSHPPPPHLTGPSRSDGLGSTSLSASAGHKRHTLEEQGNGASELGKLSKG